MSELPSLSQQEQSAFELMDHQQQSVHPLMTSVASSAQRPTYPILQRIVPNHQHQIQQPQVFMNNGPSDYSYFPSHSFESQQQSFIQGNQQVFVQDQQNQLLHNSSVLVQQQELSVQSQVPNHSVEQPLDEDLDDEEELEEEVNSVKVVKQKRTRKKKDPNAPPAAM